MKSLISSPPLLYALQNLDGIWIVANEEERRITRRGTTWIIRGWTEHVWGNLDATRLAICGFPLCISDVGFSLLCQLV